MIESKRAARGALVIGGKVVWLGLAPLMNRDDVVGVVVVESALTSLPQPSAVGGAMLTYRGGVLMGRPPKGFNAIPRKIPQTPFTFISVVDPVEARTVRSIRTPTELIRLRVCRCWLVEKELTPFPDVLQHVRLFRRCGPALHVFGFYQIHGRETKHNKK